MFTLRSSQLLSRSRPALLSRLVLRPARAITTSIVAMSVKLYVGNLSWDCQKADLEDAFGKFGTVEDAFIPTDRMSGRSRGFGFVTMDEAGAKSAISEMDGQDFMGRTVRVNEAQPMGDRPPRDFGDGGGRGGYGGGDGGGYRGRGGGRGGRGGYNARDEY